MRSSYLKRHVKWFKSIVAAFKTKGEKVKRTLHIKHCWNTIRKKEKNTTHSGAIFETCQTGRFYSMNKSLLDTNKNIPRFFLPHSKVLCFFLSQWVSFLFLAIATTSLNTFTTLFFLLTEQNQNALEAMKTCRKNTSEENTKKTYNENVFVSHCLLFVFGLLITHIALPRFVCRRSAVQFFLLLLLAV